MLEHGIRHLPVLHGGQLVGIISDRDVHFVESLKDVDPRMLPVSDAMSSEVYAVAPDALLADVVREMGVKRYGSVVVVRDGKVVGIFTAVDACRTLAELLRTSPLATSQTPR